MSKKVEKKTTLTVRSMHEGYAMLLDCFDRLKDIVDGGPIDFALGNIFKGVQEKNPKVLRGVQDKDKYLRLNLNKLLAGISESEGLLIEMKGITDLMLGAVNGKYGSFKDFYQDLGAREGVNLEPEGPNSAGEGPLGLLEGDFPTEGG